MRFARKALSWAAVSTTLNEEVLLSSVDAARPDPRPAGGEQPAWIIPELPPEYAEIARKIDDLRQEARKYERLADILWCVGEPLTAGVRAVFQSWRPGGSPERCVRRCSIVTCSFIAPVNSGR